MSLEPIGAHETRSGLTRYAIWEWIDADGPRRIPCDVMAALTKTRIPKNATCGTPVRLDVRRRAPCIAKVALLADLVDEQGILTERGHVIRSHFHRRVGVQHGWETAHGETVPF